MVKIGIRPTIDGQMCIRDREYGMRVESEYHRGTRVTITLPARKGKEPR